jgi:hypothetical protein
MTEENTHKRDVYLFTSFFYIFFIIQFYEHRQKIYWSLANLLQFQMDYKTCNGRAKGLSYVNASALSNRMF